MKALLDYFLFNNWQRKLLSLMLAIFTWFLVNHYITSDQRFTEVPVHLKNLGPNRTVKGLKAGNILPQKISLGIKGKKYVFRKVKPGDLEIVLDASNKPENWTPEITRYDIIDKSGTIDLSNVISDVTYSPFTVALEPTFEVPLTVHVTPPRGTAPRGYHFMNVSPRKFHMKVRTSKQEAEHFQSHIAKLNLDLNRISTQQLDELREKNQDKSKEIVCFPVPDAWKKVLLPNDMHTRVMLNDPAAENMHITFMYEELLPLPKKLPVALFFPTALSSKLNPESLKLGNNGDLIMSNGLYVLDADLYVDNVSALFLETVKDYLQISIHFDLAKSSQDRFRWSLELINTNELEERYVEEAIIQGKMSREDAPMLIEQFHTLLKKMRLYTAPHKPLSLQVSQRGEYIHIRKISPERKAASLR